MLIFHHISDISLWLVQQKKAGKKVGFVPTMGALHAGHLSLIQESRSKTDCTVCSIFVNPTQFNDPEDFKKYPITTESDILLLEQSACDVLFLPSISEMYPIGLKSPTPFNLGYLETILEGKYRPGHFQGVCQVVKRLLEIVHPEMLFLGQKDYQQVMVIKKMIQLLGWTIEVQVVPTLRENNGLAMSSRNQRLSKEGKSTAIGIYETLVKIRSQIKPGNLSQLKQNASRSLIEKGFKVDYTEIALADTLEEVENWNGTDKIVALIAAYLHDVRLIDNLVLN